MSSLCLSIVMLGPGGVGKSALSVRYVNDHFVEKYDPTVEDSHRKQVTYGDRSVMVEIADTAGQEEYRSLQMQYIKSADVIILVGSPDASSSISKISATYELILQTSSEQQDQSDSIPVVVVCNKIDFIIGVDKPRLIKRFGGSQPLPPPPPSESMREKLYAFAQAKATSYVETSAKTGVNVNELFQLALEHIEMQCGGTFTKRRGRKQQRLKQQKQQIQKSKGCTMI